MCPLRSVAVTVNVCGPAVLVFRRPPLWIGAPESERPVQLCTPPGSEQSNVARTCWFRTNVPLGNGCEMARDGAPVSGTDWKLTALLKLKPTLPALSWT